MLDLVKRFDFVKGKFEQKAKNFIITQFEAKGFDIVRRTSKLGPNIDILTFFIESLLRMGLKGGVIQIGANDGVMGDPVRRAILTMNLPALLVEPLPDIFEKLKSNYAQQDFIRLENVAISTTPGEAEIFRVSAQAHHLPAWAHGIASFDKTVLLRHRNWPGVDDDFEDCIESVLVPVITFGELLARHPDISDVLVLQIDTEGHDAIVLKSAVEAGCLPPIINFEHKHLSHDDQTLCRRMLIPYGYSFLCQETDTLALRNSTTVPPNPIGDGPHLA